MSRRAQRSYLVLAIGGVLTVAAARMLFDTGCAPNGPRTIEEAMAIAEARGLYATRDGAGAPTGKNAIVSDTPLTWQQAAMLCVNRPGSPRWTGCARVYSGWQTMMANYDPHCALIWGEMFVFGDPDLIERLTDRRP